MLKKGLIYLLSASMLLGVFHLSVMKVVAGEMITEEGLGEIPVEIPTEKDETDGIESLTEENSIKDQTEESPIEEEVLKENDVQENEIQGVVEEEAESVEKEDVNVMEENAFDELAERHKNELPDGTYYIRTKLVDNKVLSVKDHSLSNKANVLIKNFEKTDSQRWKVIHDQKGYVTFVNEKSGKVLDVSNGGKNADKTVWQYTSNQTLAQKWIAQKEGSYYKIISALNGMVLDVKGGKTTDNTGLQIYSSNNSNAQKFQMIPKNPTIEKCDEVIPSGYYYICAKSDENYVLDIKGGSNVNKANVQLYKANNSFAQAFELQYKNGYYTVRNMYSNKMLDVAFGGYMPTTNVWQYNDNGTNAQKWSIKEHEDGSYSFNNVHNGMALDIAGGNIVSGSNIQIYTPNGSVAQKFVLKRAEAFYEGWYNICSTMNSAYVMEIAGGNIENKTNIQLYKNNGTQSQKWNAIKNSDGTFRFVNAKSRKVMDVANGKIYQGNSVWEYSYNGTDAQKWKVEKLEDNTWRIASVKNPEYVLSLERASISNKTKLTIKKWANKAEQKWSFSKVSSVKYVQKIVISEGKEYVLDKGKTYTLKAKEVYANNTVGHELQWTSSNSNVAVSNTGKITAVRHGNAVITATSKNDKNVKGEIRVYVRETKGQLTKGKLDSLNLSNAKKLMIVAHPDDETFWGGGHLLEGDWLVVCITNGRSKTRSKEFASAMNYSGDKAIMLDYADVNDNRARDNWKYAESAIRQDIRLLVAYKNWSQITVHNPSGEYGHMHHKMASKYTTEICKEKGKYNCLYYFGKFYKDVPNNLKTNIGGNTLKRKQNMIKIYSSQLAGYYKSFKQMEAHEHWVKASNW